MLIAIDGFEASAPERVGVGRLEVELLKAIAHIDKKNSYRVYTPYAPLGDLPPETNRFKYEIPSFKRLWSQVALPVKLVVDTPKPDVFYAPVHYAPRYCPVPLVVGIMDLSYIHFPELFKPIDLYKLKNWTAYSVNKAQGVIAISQSTKSDILKTYDIDPQKVHVVYPGINKFKTTMKGSYGIKDEYILYVGTLQPRKNIVRLIEAFKKVKSDGSGVTGLQLVIVGKKGWLYDEILGKAKELGIEKDVVFTGFVPDSQLPLLYANAKCFCFPSLYEGFGFPVLEAMQYGCPVVASNVSSLPELVGDAGVLVDPQSVDSIAQGLKEVLTLKHEARMKRIEKGKKQASTFTWERAARETIDILESVAKHE